MIRSVQDYISTKLRNESDELSRIIQQDAKLLEDDNFNLVFTTPTVQVIPICSVDEKWLDAKGYVLGYHPNGLIVQHENGTVNIFDKQEVIHLDSDLIEVADYLTLVKLQHNLLHYSRSLSNRIDELLEQHNITLHYFGSFIEKLERLVIELGGIVNYDNLVSNSNILKQKLLIDQIEQLLIKQEVEKSEH